MYAAQDGKCAICAKGAEDELHGVFSVDHDHVTGAVRALLCRPCNLGLGKFEDDPKRLLAAVEYLNKHTMLPIA